MWAGVLYGGEGAVASGETAAYLCGLTDRAPSYVEISVDARRRVDDVRGLDLIDRATSTDRVVSLITGPCQRRLSTAGRLGQAAARRGDCGGADWSIRFSTMYGPA